MRLWMKVNSFHVMVAETEGNEVTPRIPAITRANIPKGIRVIESEWLFLQSIEQIYFHKMLGDMSHYNISTGIRYKKVYNNSNH